MRSLHFNSFRVAAVVSALIGSLISAPSAQAQFLKHPATQWGHIYAGTNPVTTTSPRPKNAVGDVKSKFDVTYSNFPDWAKKEVQAAVDIWSANFASTVIVSIDASWGRSSSWGVLGSARPSNFFSAFPGAPDSSLWYTSALANALSGKDLDKANPDIVIQVNANGGWNTRGDGLPTSREYDLQSVFLHEIAHGIGFLSNDSYDSFFSIASLDQPTPYDAYAQTLDGRRLADLPTPSRELATALTSSLVWSGQFATAANGGIKPKLYTPGNYEPGSSVSHLDEATFSKSGLDSVMTPSLDPGEIFKEPGPLLLAMIEDMRTKPPAGLASGLAQPPRNARALIADSSALISFDPPVNIRTAAISEYIVKNLRTGAEKRSLSSPVVMSGLKNGASYTFTVVAKNELGISDPATTSVMVPQAGWKSTVLDSGADGKSVVSVVFNGKPTIAYTDTKSGDLKLATLDAKTWKKTIVDGAGGSSGRTVNAIGNPISLCVNGTGTKQTLHIFYSDVTDKDLRYASYNGKAFTYDVIDGNGPSINNYEDIVRVRTSSDVSVTNACVANANGVQVFYRDESQGILLGAVKAKSGAWVYELVDGDRKTDGRSTGDVGFHLQALIDGTKTFVLYDSVISLNQKKEVTAGAVRVATRIGSDATAWSYQTLDISNEQASVFGYGLALAKVSGGVMAAWLASSIESLPKPNQIRWAMLNSSMEITSITTESFGTPSAYLSINGKTIVFNCQERLCALDTGRASAGQSAISLIRNGQNLDPSQSAWVSINKVRFLLASVNNKLALLKP